jgi:hypothetical protein
MFQELTAVPKYRIWTMSNFRLTASVAAFILAGIVPTPSQRLEPPVDNDACRAIMDHNMQLRCYEMSNALGNQMNAQRTDLLNGWRLVRIPNARGGADAVSITHSADLQKSDPNLVGIVLRCEGGPIDVLLVVIEPYPPQAAIDLTIKVDGSTALTFRGSVIHPGVMIRLPNEIATSIIQRGRSADELSVRMEYGNTRPVAGIVKLAGFAGAIEALTKLCQA